MFTTRPELKGHFGAVASTHWLASQCGMAVLERGGNAFDAAVAAGFVLQVVEPHLNGPGGEVPIIFHDNKSGDTKVICGQGCAPAGATIAHYQAQGLDLIPGSGLLATVIPGAFDAWMLLLRDYGTWGPAEVLDYAIYYAREGIPVVPLIAATIGRVESLFREEWTTSAATYMPGGRVPEAGTLLANAVLAETYGRIAKEAKAAGNSREKQIEAARKAWSQGFIAQAIDDFFRHAEAMDVSGQRNKGVLTGADLAGWQASYEAPVGYDYHGWRVLKNGPWSQGPVFLQQLALLKGFDLAAMDPAGPDFVHTVNECAKLAFADREAYYGDPDFVDVPIETLLSDAYNDTRRKKVGKDASFDLVAGEIPGFSNHIDFTVKVFDPKADDFDSMGVGEPTAQTGDEKGEVKGDTCHLDVIDKDGNMVAATPSGGWLQSSPVVPALGFCLNSRAQMFWMKEGTPAALAPGKRPRTTLSTNLMLKDGKPTLVMGTPGGDQQDQWTLHVFLRHVHHGLNLQEAIDFPAFHTDHMPSSFWPRAADLGSLSLETRFPKATVDALKKRGHKTVTVDPWSLGRVSAIRKDGKVIRAGANPRFMQGYAVAR